MVTPLPVDDMLFSFIIVVDTNSLIIKVNKEGDGNVRR